VAALVILISLPAGRQGWKAEIHGEAGKHPLCCLSLDLLPTFVAMTKVGPSAGEAPQGKILY